MTLKKSKLAGAYPNLLLRVRIDLPQDTDVDPSIIVSWLQQYCDRRGFKVLRSTAGVHKICKRGNPHIHYHAEVDVAKVKLYKTGERYALRQDIQKDKPTFFRPYGNSFSAAVEKPKIHELMEVEDCINTFLRYPLKENIPVYIGCLGYTDGEIETMCKLANDEFQNILRQTKEKEIKDEEDRLKWTKLVRDLDNSDASTYAECCLHLLYLSKSSTDLQKTTQDRLCNLARNYARLRDLHSPDEFLQNPTHLMLYNIQNKKHSLKKQNMIGILNLAQNKILY